MRITIVGSTTDRPSPRQFAASYLINDTIAIDAGTLGLMASIERQRAVDHVFLSHAHLDHVASLAIFIDNVYRCDPTAPTIYASQFTHDCLMQDMFNDRLWPDLQRLSQQESPFVRFQSFEDGSSVVIGDITVHAVALDHVIPCLAFIVEDAESAIAIVSDTGPTEAIWRALRAQTTLSAVFLEAAFPNSMEWLATASAHLTPRKFLHEYRKLDRDVPVYAVHIKPAFYEEVVADLESLNIPQLQISQPNVAYQF